MSLRLGGRGAGGWSDISVLDNCGCHGRLGVGQLRHRRPRHRHRQFDPRTFLTHGVGGDSSHHRPHQPGRHHPPLPGARRGRPDGAHGRGRRAPAGRAGRCRPGGHGHGPRRRAHPPDLYGLPRRERAARPRSSQLPSIADRRRRSRHAHRAPPFGSVYALCVPERDRAKDPCEGGLLVGRPVGASPGRGSLPHVSQRVDAGPRPLAAGTTSSKPHS